MAPNDLRRRFVFAFFVWVILYTSSAAYLILADQAAEFLRIGALMAGFLLAVAASVTSAAILLNRYLGARSLAGLLAVPSVSAPIFTAPMLTHASPMGCRMNPSNCIAETGTFTIALLAFSFSGFLVIAISARKKSKQ
jgi:hypothetical protein